MAYAFTCSWTAGFVPTGNQRVGYLTDFNGLGLSTALARDLQVRCLYNGAGPTYTPLGGLVGGMVTVTAVLESVSWGGNVGDPFAFSCYMSQENASQLRALQQMTLKTTSIKAVGWWVANFGTTWFEQHFPFSPAKPTAQLNSVSGAVRLNIDADPVKVAPTIEVYVYKVYFEMVPAANQMATIMVATSSTSKILKNWGLVVGIQPAPVGA